MHALVNLTFPEIEHGLLALVVLGAAFFCLLVAVSFVRAALHVLRRPRKSHPSQAARVNRMGEHPYRARLVRSSLWQA